MQKDRHTIRYPLKATENQSFIFDIALGPPSKHERILRANAPNSQRPSLSIIQFAQDYAHRFCSA